MRVTYGPFLHFSYPRPKIELTLNNSRPVADEPAAHRPSDSQLLAIEADPQPLLVLAGPGAGKTFCLIERIRFLVEQKQFDPARICAFTFTNKAAGEISDRLVKYLGPAAERVKRGTIHAFCAELLREFGTEVGLEPGFGIADEEYQDLVLRRVGVPARWRGLALRAFTSHRFVRGYAMQDRDFSRYVEYSGILDKRNLVDFDMLILKTADLLRIESVAETVRRRWDAVLVDEFQDLNPVQYSIIRSLAEEHGNIFAVGDDDQSIYAWAGADREVFSEFINDFKLAGPKTQLAENRRCPREVIELAGRLIDINTPMFAQRLRGGNERSSPFPITALKFENSESELQWIIQDLRRDRDAHGHGWENIAVLYRKHEIGYAAEAQFLAEGIPCRMGQGHAMADDPVVRHVVAALRVIADPKDPIQQELFLHAVLPPPLFDRVQAKAQEKRRSILDHLERTSHRTSKDDADGKKLRRSIVALRNLTALATRQDDVAGLVDEILSHGVGQYRTMLEDNHDVLSDPADNEEVQLLATRLADALDLGRTVWLPRMGGLEIAIKGMLAGIELNRVQLGGMPPPDAVSIGHPDSRLLGLALGVFKAIQLLRSREFTNHFRDFTAVDIETTDNDIATSEVVEIAAVRVRDGEVVKEFRSLVKPRVPITRGAQEAHGFSQDDVSGAPFFEEVWPLFREFCGSDVVVAHNGHNFDFPILRRMAGKAESAEMFTYDTLLLARELRTGSASLENLARVYGIDGGRAHHALDDTRTLAHVFLALGEDKIVRARKTNLDGLLDYLGIALALSDDETLGEEARRLRDVSRIRSLSRYSHCLDFYRLESEQANDVSIPTVDDVIVLLGGVELMLRLRAEKTADERFPEAMARLRPLLQLQRGKPLKEQIAGFLERIALSKWDGASPDTGRVSLLTLHSTKGLEFSRVYILGTDDAGFGRTAKKSKPEIEELRRLLYVGMTRTMDRLVLTCSESRNGDPTGGHQFLEEMGLAPTAAL